MPFLSHKIKLTTILIPALWLVTACSHHKQPKTIENIPVLTSINIIDRNGLTETINNPERLGQYACVDFLQPQSYQKVLRIYSRDAEGNVPACITSYHPNGYPYQALEVLNCRACGDYREWYPNGVKKIEAHIIEGSGDIIDGAEKTWIFDGCSQVWKENGNLEATMPYEKGLLEGVSTYYHDNGQVWKIIPYHKNQINGVFQIYLANGDLLQSCQYNQGVKEGPAKRYWNPDRLAAEEAYCEGLLSSGRYYNCDGECIASIDEGNGTRAIFGKEAITELHDYRYGIPEGEVKLFDSYNRVKKIYHVKNGCKQGEELHFYDAVRLQKKLLPKLSVNWYEGKIQGTTKTWYDNGAQESQKEMSNNKKNGHCTAWYRDGNLMLIEEYEQDKLVRGEYYMKGEKLSVSEVSQGNGVVTLYDGEGNFIQKVTYVNGKPRLDE